MDIIDDKTKHTTPHHRRVTARHLRERAFAFCYDVQRRGSAVFKVRVCVCVCVCMSLCLCACWCSSLAVVDGTCYRATVIANEQRHATPLMPSHVVDVHVCRLAFTAHALHWARILRDENAAMEIFTACVGVWFFSPFAALLITRWCMVLLPFSGWEGRVGGKRLCNQSLSNNPIHCSRWWLWWT